MLEVAVVVVARHLGTICLGAFEERSKDGWYLEYAAYGRGTAVPQQQQQQQYVRRSQMTRKQQPALVEITICPSYSSLLQCFAFLPLLLNVAVINPPRFLRTHRFWQVVARVHMVESAERKRDGKRGVPFRARSRRELRSSPLLYPRCLSVSDPSSTRHKRPPFFFLRAAPSRKKNMHVRSIYILITSKIILWRTLHDVSRFTVHLFYDPPCRRCAPPERHKQ